MSKSPRSPLSGAAPSFVANEVLLRTPNVDGSDFWGPLVSPDWPSSEARHQRSSKWRDGGRVGRGTKGLLVGRLNTIPSDGVGSRQGFHVVRQSTRLLCPRQDFPFDCSETVPREELSQRHTPAL